MKDEEDEDYIDLIISLNHFKKHANYKCKFVVQDSNQYASINKKINTIINNAYML